MTLKDAKCEDKRPSSRPAFGDAACVHRVDWTLAGVVVVVGGKAGVVQPTEEHRQSEGIPRPISPSAKAFSTESCAQR